MSGTAAQATIQTGDRRLSISRAAAPALLLGPFLVLLAVFHYIPLLSMLRNSFLSYDLVSPQSAEWTGLDNYARILENHDTLIAFRVTLIFTVAFVAMEVPIGLALALLVNRTARGIGLVRGAIFGPVVTSVVVIATVWNLILNPTNGLLNAALGTLGLGRLEFLTSSQQALPSILVMTLWQQAGFGMVLFLAGLQAIPREVLEAAAVDGAGTLRRFRHVTLPLLRRTAAVVVVVSTTYAFNAFAPAYVMTQGGPENSTLLLVFHIYQQAFLFFDAGYASALSCVLLGVALIVGTIELRFLQARWRY